MIKTIVFDFFGVLCPDLHRIWLEKNVKDIQRKQDVFQKLSDEVDRGIISEDDFITSVVTGTGKSATVAKKEMLALAQIDQELLILIGRLKQTYKIAILSSAHYTLLEEILTKNNLNSLFDEVIISSRVGFLKSEPELYEIMLKKVNVHRSEVIYIDDAQKNIAMAVQLGIPAIKYEGVAKLVVELNRAGCKV